MPAGQPQISLATAGNGLTADSTGDGAACGRGGSEGDVEGAASSRIRPEGNTAAFRKSERKGERTVLEKDLGRDHHVGVSIEGSVRDRAIGRRDGECWVGGAVAGIVEREDEIAGDADGASVGAIAGIGDGNVARFAAVGDRAAGWG